MPAATKPQQTRRPRFRRAADAPAFRFTDGDLEIVSLLARHRFLRSTHIAALVGRSLDRVNDRLLRLFHAGYVDRPRAQLDYYPTSGSAPFIYALADQGACLLAEHDSAHFSHLEWGRKNHKAGRPFIEHQIEIMDFYVSLQLAVRNRPDLSFIHADELAAQCPTQALDRKTPFALHVHINKGGVTHEVSAVPDLAFGIRYSDGSRRCFLVEIDRGTMPVARSDVRQTSFERKMRAYLAAHTAKLHTRHFGWKAFRVLTVTTDDLRLRAMQDALHLLGNADGPGARLFMFASRQGLGDTDPLGPIWRDGDGLSVALA